MPINISKIVEKTQEITNDSAGGSTELELSRVAEIANIIENSSVYSVPTTSNLPTAANNTGRFAYVDDQCRYYYSNGTSWTDDYVTTDLTSLQIWMFGNNNLGQLGLNYISPNCVSTPTQEHCGGTNWCTVSAGGYHTLSIKTDGTLWSWGCNGQGRLGTNNTTNYSTPTQEHCGGTNWCMVSAGGYHTLSIKTDGTLWSWGRNDYGQLGTNNFIICRSTPTQEHCGGTNWCVVSGGVIHTSAIKTDGTLWSWGYNNNGELGTNNTTNYSTPTQEACEGTNWCMVNAGCTYSSAIKTDGTLWSWGRNSCGLLGTNNTTNYSTPTQEACGGTNWCMVETGRYHTSAIKTDGTLWSWGYNYYGQLGLNNKYIDYSTPQQEICGGTNWNMMSIIDYHTSSIKTDGTLWSWGRNNCGQLGTNNSICYSTPTQEACGFTDWTQPYLRGTLDTSGF